MRHTIVFVVGLWRLCGAQMPQPTDATGSRTTPLIQDVRSSLRSASAALPLFDTQAFIYNRSPHLARSIEGKYRRTLAGLVEGKYDSEYLIQLLYDPQPRVRTLAMALLFQKDDPKLLAYVSQLLDDSAETFPVPTLTAILLDPMPTSPQTVGEVAKAMVGVYMRAAGMKEWRAPGSEAWTAYQTTHRSRPYYFSWFVCD